MPLYAKYGIIADIHANYTALKVALDYLQMAGVDKILCLGDIVGYGAQPFECIEALKDKPNIDVSTMLKTHPDMKDLPAESADAM